MPVVGTAGHVDHGKSTLVAALTGRDPDRWEEEKRRGLTIDLGFAWCELPGGVEVSFVDVPGHERYVKNMLAGIEAIDAALFVVAADEGWMPQSEEHLAVLDLLEVEAGVVAVTKSDRVDPDLVELAVEEVRDHVVRTSLEQATIVPVSVPAARGLDGLVRELGHAVGSLPSPPPSPSRLWVDRVFTVAGAGTVVTGTLLGGPLEVGAEVEMWPGGDVARIRGLQTHERSVERAEPRRRVAVNLGGIGRAELARGAMIGAPGSWRPTRRMLASFRTARYVDGLTDRGAYHLHAGSGAWPVSVRVLEESDGAGIALLTLQTGLCLPAGDRFILRDTGRRAVVAGGRVLDPDPRRGPGLTATAPLLVRALGGTADDRASALLEARGRDQITRLGIDSGGGRPATGSVVGELALSGEEVARLGRRIREEVASFHRRHPLRPGIPTAQVASTLDLEPEVVAWLARADPALEAADGILRSTDATTPDPAGDPRWGPARERLVDEWPLAPSPVELGLDQELVHALERAGEVVRVTAEIVYLPEQVEEIRRILARLGEGFTVGEFREAAGMSRKYAVPVLEWADRAGLTVRMGDVRRFRGA